MEKEKLVDKVMKKISMSRGVLVLDENVENLKEDLRKLNIKIIFPKKGLSDKSIKEELLFHRILVTKNSKDFVGDASIFEYGIIAIERVKGTEENIADLISEVIMKYSLWSKKHGFIVKIDSKGNSSFEPLTD